MAKENLEQDLNKVIQQLPLDSYNFANNTKWVFNIPIGHLLNDKRRKQPQRNDFPMEYPLNCKKINFPGFQMGTTKTAFYGYGFELPTGQNISEKTITIQYILSNNWIQYLLLLKWFNLMDYTRYDEETNKNRDTSYNSVSNKELYQTVSNKNDAVYNPFESVGGPIFPTSLYLMDNFNHRLFTIYFEKTWLQSVESVDLNYSNTSDTEITSSFKLKFYKYNIIINDDFLETLFTEQITFANKNG